MVRQTRIMQAPASSLGALIVGASAEDSALLTSDLEKIGYTCTFVPSAVLALKTLASESFDLLLLHVNLPDATGVNLCNEIRELYGTRMVIVLLNDEQNESAAATALQLGADDCLALPCDMQELVLRITAHMRRYIQVVHRGGNTSIVSSLVASLFCSRKL